MVLMKQSASGRAATADKVRSIDTVLSAPEKVPVTELFVNLLLRQTVRIDGRGVLRNHAPGETLRERQSLTGIVAKDHIIEAVEYRQRSSDAR